MERRVVRVARRRLGLLLDGGPHTRLQQRGVAVPVVVVVGRGSSRHLAVDTMSDVPLPGSAAEPSEMEADQPSLRPG